MINECHGLKRVHGFYVYTLQADYVSSAQRHDSVDCDGFGKKNASSGYDSENFVRIKSLSIIHQIKADGEWILHSPSALIYVK